MMTHKIISGTLTYTGCQLLGRIFFNCKSNGFSEKFSGNTASWTTISSWSWMRVSKGVRAILSRPSPIRQPAPLDSARLSSSSKIRRVDPSQTVLSSRAVLVWVLPFTVVSCVACQLIESSSRGPLYLLSEPPSLCLSSSPLYVTVVTLYVALVLCLRLI
jgi:hypothetical protein